MPTPTFRRRAAAAALAAALPAATSCREILQADAPQLIEESSLTVAANAPVLVAGLVGDFECAFSQYVTVAGTVSDEFSDSQANAATWDMDRRTLFPSTAPAANTYPGNACPAPPTAPSFGGVYVPVATARYQADNAERLLDGWTDAEVPGRALLRARAAAYGGYAMTLLGEGFCSASIDLGPELTPAQVFAAAEERFTRAVAAAQAAGGAAGDSIRFMALVGRARVRLNQNKRAEAAADAALVPANFVFNARYTAATGRSENRVFRVNNTAGSVTVDSTYRDVRTGGVLDPRVPVADAGRGGSLAQVRLWAQNKYTSLSAPIPIATWREALLIRAEVAAAGGDAAGAAGFINQLRAGVSLPPFAPANAAEASAQIVEERRRELFLESHRLYDTIRFNVPLRPAAGAPFPNGGGTYGSAKCLPLPDNERLNNPALTGST